MTRINCQLVNALLNNADFLKSGSFNSLPDHEGQELALRRYRSLLLEAVGKRIDGAEIPGPRLAVILEGGIVQVIVSDCPDAFANIEVLIVDYDVGDLDGAFDVPQGDGSIEKAVGHFESVGQAVIDLSRLADAIIKARPDLYSMPDSD